MMRRHHWLVLVFAYTVFHAVLGKASEPADAGLEVSLAPVLRSTGPFKESELPELEKVRSTEEENIDAGNEEIFKEELKLEDAIPTFRPPRTCTPPAIEQFPVPLMGQSARRHGGLIVHVLVAVFTFIGLAIVCRNYFVPSLERICYELQLAPDVAGATFMAACSSAPELATVVIGVFCAQDDIGVSGVIGSAVFNIMFVISVCALCAGTVSHLNWWPLCRDCFFYAVSILVMLCTISNGYVSWTEALFMLCIYGVYCVALRFNVTFERWALSFKLPTREQATTVTNKEESTLVVAGGQPEQITPQQEQPEPEAPAQQDKAKVYNPEFPVNPLLKPVNASRCQQLRWYVAYPVHWSCRHTMPDCQGRWYPVTFVISMLWISFYSYFMVWMITIIGYTLGLPDSVMGLTFVAAGFSVPDMLCSLAVMKKGHGDMAVSNAVGSNVFDILVCLGLPWFIQTAIIHPGSHVNVISKGLIYSTLSLFSTVIFLVVATHANGWKLDRKFGAVLMVWYLLFITLASLYELNIFGNHHPPDCASPY